MEDSLGSPVNKAVASKDTTIDGPEEESGWTSYFEDFLSKQREQEEEEEEHNNTSFSDSFGSPSLVSDAASSCVPRKINNYNQVSARCSPMDSPPKMPKKLSFKKARTKEISHDDSLEDTASSPVNSPKINSFKQVDINPRKRGDNVESSLGKGGGSDFSSELHRDSRNEMTFEGKNNEYIELKKRGLCLVPLSMLVNYLG
ncbi:hypothetical protein ACSBR2_027667 [Camellia fascicularis]